jgi:hypothetical protein
MLIMKFYMLEEIDGSKVVDRNFLLYAMQ